MNETYPTEIGQRALIHLRREDIVTNHSEVEDAAQLDLRDYLRIVRRRAKLVAVCFLGTVLTTAAVLFTTQPTYTANTTILIERHDPQIVDIKQVLSEPPGPDEHDYYKTQYEILRSRSLAAEVVREQKLAQNPLVNPDGQQRGVDAALASLKTWISQWLAAQSGAGASAALETRLIEHYLNELLEIEPVNGTRLAKISVSTPDPVLSARLANAHTESYVRQGLKLRSEASREAHQFLEEKLEELKERVTKSEGALNSYRKDKGILALDDKENVVVERLADLNKSLTSAEVDRIALESQERLIRKRDYDSLPAVIASPLIATLKGQLTNLQGEYANLSSQFKPGYPRLDQVKANLEEIQLRLQQETKKIVAGIESAYLAAEGKEKALRGKMDQQKTAALQLKDTSVNYAILAREAETNRQLHDSVLGRIKELGVTTGLPTSNVFIIDHATTPLAPSKPRKMLSLLMGGVVGLLAGLGLGFLFEYLDKTFKTAEEAERYLSLPNLGVVPDFLSGNRRLFERATAASWRAVPTRETVTVAAPDTVFYPNDPQQKLAFSAQPAGLVNEAYRTLRTGILLSQAGDCPKTVLFASAVHGEGKTDTAVNSAIKFAQTGAKVLLIDADLRRPTCHKILGMRQGLGVAELLSGKIESGWAIQSTHVDNLFFMASGTSTSNPTELIGSKKMAETLAWASRQYDHILIDSPPLMAVSDAMLLSTMADGVVLVIGGQSTPRDLVKQACTKLHYARARILGMVLNRVDPNSGEYRNYRYPYGGYIEVAPEQA
jgi:polysaccharide biosynthesis transport protein